MALERPQRRARRHILEPRYVVPRPGHDRHAARGEGTELTGLSRPQKSPVPQHSLRHNYA